MFKSVYLVNYLFVDWFQCHLLISIDSYILFQHQSYSLVSHLRYVQVARAISCARNPRAVSRIFWSSLVMANTSKQTLSTEAEDALLNNDHDPKEKTPTTAHRFPWSVCFRTSTKLSERWQTRSSTWTSHSSSFIPVTDDQLDPKWWKYSFKDWVVPMVQIMMEMTRTRNFRPFVALKPTKPPKINPMLHSSKAQITEDLLNVDESGLAAEKQLADFINNLWSKKLPDSKLKDRSGKYLHPVNCETLATPQVNPEICDKLSHSVKQQDLRSSLTQKTVGTAGTVLCKSIELLLEMKNLKQPKSNSDIQKLIKLNTDAVALLGHAYVNLSHCRWESIKPHLNKDYAGLCASHVPVTALLFGNDLQSQLNIPASNRVSTMFLDKWKEITSDSEVLIVLRVNILNFPHSPQRTWAWKGKLSTSVTHWL